MNRACRNGLIAVIASVSILGCTKLHVDDAGDSADAGERDAGSSPDAGSDAGSGPDAGSDAGTDAGEACTAVAETCNGADDDCDEIVDEGAADELGCTELEACVESCICAAASCRGGFASWPVPGTPGHPRDYDAGVLTVTDRVTGLEWQRTRMPSTYNWMGAQAACAALDLDGKTDWRLPARIELASLLDYTAEAAPYIDQDVFMDEGSRYWSSSAVNEDPTVDAWIVDFDGSGPDDLPQSGAMWVRCVRTATYREAAEPQFVNHGDGTVTDMGTELMWMEATTTGATSGASAACDDLDFAGHADWRLPAVVELLTLVDESRINPSLDVVAFPGSQSAGYHSTSAPDHGTNRPAVHFYRGEVFDRALSEGGNRRCVR